MQFTLDQFSFATSEICPQLPSGGRGTGRRPIYERSKTVIQRRLRHVRLAHTCRLCCAPGDPEAKGRSAPEIEFNWGDPGRLIPPLLPGCCVQLYCPQGSSPVRCWLKLRRPLSRSRIVGDLDNMLNAIPRATTALLTRYSLAFE